MSHCRSFTIFRYWAFSLTNCSPKELLFRAGRVISRRLLGTRHHQFQVIEDDVAHLPLMVAERQTDEACVFMPAIGIAAIAVGIRRERGRLRPAVAGEAAGKERARGGR